ncbi:3-phenylpropionate/trans-cinnamate dioxygenase ferredoxin reductase subunit [Pseudonocardia hierapolitana]|uniref:3-phenylpropionate/trans-cinnamate dioxygenase ferredoxin reductase subunit n=1 Tax=Pseudonocardia hierapolitana TaxID=1128676 RepID=A0A561T029_9PSEU|nr:FAD-dependent oxidoreductase [Pseudonocardia hierapolitana]TWF80476.1 3-phenylpropionate/trans-cinnamate dioxygenase ferredoxin reductase subunit [Pseudonocardia hierapolitana]
MSDPRTFAIVGAGLAGAKAAEALCTEGFDGRIVLFGAEPHRPYERPPLSKGYLQGSSDRDTVYVHPPDWYTEHQVELRLDTPVTAIDRRAHEIVTGDGGRLHYDKLLLATGATPRKLTVPGSELDGVRYLRSLDDSDHLASAFRPGAKVVIIGGGWIGLETAAAARGAGAEVTVLERAELPLLRVLGPRVAKVFADLHRDHDVDLRCRVTVKAIRPAAGDPSSAGTVLLTGGTELEADVIVVGIGVVPNVELARSCGLNVDNGVLVDRHLVTSDRDILAAGDVANAYHPLLHRQLRVEHWANALHQPVIAGQTMLGRAASYDRLPYFFTDQYDLGMEYTGYTDPDGHDDVVIRGDTATREFIAFWLNNGRLTAAMNVNVWEVTEPIRELIRSGTQVDANRLTDLDVPLTHATVG